MTDETKGRASPLRGRATHEPSPQAVSALRVGIADAKAPGCRECVYHHSFRARADEQERYGFGETGYGCKHPIDGGVYVLNPDAPTCLRGPVVRATGAA